VIEDDSGCGCRIAGSRADPASALLLGLLGMLVVRRRRRLAIPRAHRHRV